MAPVSVRFNNPGALNTASWVMAYPGYTGAKETTPGNHTASFDTQENGVAAWWELMRRYRAAGAVTSKAIITRYGGTGQNYSSYVAAVAKHGIKPETVIDIHDDHSLLPFAKAMFQYEAGQAGTLTDDQIRYGFALARSRVGEEPTPWFWRFIRFLWQSQS